MGIQERLYGYVNFSLAYASPEMTGRNITCRYNSLCHYNLMTTCILSTVLVNIR